MVLPPLFLAGAASLFAAPETGVRVEEAERMLVACASGAKQRLNRPELDQCLRGWASIAHEEPLPKGLEAEALSALAWTKAEGGLQVFGSRLDDRVSVGLRDPALVVGRIDVWVREDGVLRRLVRREAERADRLEYRLDEARAREAEVVVDAVMTRFGEDVIIRRVLMEPNEMEPLPPTPDPPQLVRRLRPMPITSTVAPPIRSSDPETALAWWWFACGALATMLVGAAIWQETRF